MLEPQRYFLTAPSSPIEVWEIPTRRTRTRNLKSERLPKSREVALWELCVSRSCMYRRFDDRGKGVGLEP
jgi:hypothetical protein